jgi:hypothetical protein
MLAAHLRRGDFGITATWCGHDRGRWDLSASPASPSARYRAIQVCTDWRETPAATATSVTFAPAGTARTASSRCSTTDNATSANLGLLISDVPRNVADVKARARANVKHQLADEWKASPGTRQRDHPPDVMSFLYGFKGAPPARHTGRPEPGFRAGASSRGSKTAGETGR